MIPVRINKEPQNLHPQHRERAEMMSNTKMSRNIYFAVVAVILADYFM